MNGEVVSLEMTMAALLDDNACNVKIVNEVFLLFLKAEEAPFTTWK